jgi:hypothetical protein
VTKFCICCGYIAPANDLLPRAYARCPASPGEGHNWPETTEPANKLCRLCGMIPGPSERCSKSDDRIHRWGALAGRPTHPWHLGGRSSLLPPASPKLRRFRHRRTDSRLLKFLKVCGSDIEISADRSAGTLEGFYVLDGFLIERLRRPDRKESLSHPLTGFAECGMTVLRPYIRLPPAVRKSQSGEIHVQSPSCIWRLIGASRIVPCCIQQIGPDHDRASSPMKRSQPKTDIEP